MKLLIILEKRAPSGFEGVARQVFYRCLEFNKRKIDYLVLYNGKDEMYKSLLKNNINIKYLPFPAKSIKNLFHQKLTIFKFRKKIKKIVKKNKISHIEVHGAYLLDFLEKKWDVKIIAYHHNAFIKNDPIKYFHINLLLQPRLLLKKFYEKLIVFNYSKADKVIAVSNAAKKTLIDKYGYSEKKENIKVIYNAVSKTNIEKKYDLRKKFKIKKTDKVILSVGRISKAKGVEDFCEVAKTFKNNINIKFIFVGEGLDQNYSNYIKNKYESFVLFPGKSFYVSNFYKISDIFLCLSHRESFSLVSVEAMHYKLPAIVWNVTGLSEVITNNYNGYCCSFGKIQSVIKKLNYLLNNKVEYERISLNAYKKKDMFSISKNVDKFLKLIN